MSHPNKDQDIISAVEEMVAQRNAVYQRKPDALQEKWNKPYRRIIHLPLLKAK